MNYFFTSRTLSEIAADGGKNCRILILNGNSTYIKSRLLSVVTIVADREGYFYEKYLSKRNYDNIAAVYIKKLNLLVADNTYFAEKYADYPENLITKINTDKVFASISEKIMEQVRFYDEKITECISKSAKNENSAKMLLEENKRLSRQYVDNVRILNYILRFIQRNHFVQKDRNGTDSRRTITEITPWGVHTCVETIMQQCSTVIVVHDESKCISCAVVSGFGEALRQFGYDTVTYSCSLVPGCCEHLAVPELSLAVFTSNRNHSYPIDDTGNLAGERFLRTALPPSHKAMYNWNIEAADEFIDESVFSLFDAMELDDVKSDLLNELINDEQYRIVQEDLIKKTFAL